MHAVPVILTSIPRYDVAGNVLLCGDGDGIEVYRDAAIEIAEEMGVAYIDVAEKMVEKTADFDAETMVGKFTEITPGRPTVAHHRHQSTVCHRY